MKRGYLIRHGLPDFPGGKRMCLGTTDIPMGAAGLAQAAEMASKLPPVTAVFSSPLTRAVQTAQAIGLPITVLDGLREMDAGQWEGLTFEEIMLRFPELYEARGSDPTLLPPGAEDPDLGLVRFSKAIKTAAESAPGDFAVVAHGGVIARFLQSVSGTWYKPGYTEVICLIYDNNHFSLAQELRKL